VEAGKILATFIICSLSKCMLLELGGISKVVNIIIKKEIK